MTPPPTSAKALKLIACEMMTVGAYTAQLEQDFDYANRFIHDPTGVGKATTVRYKVEARPKEIKASLLTSARTFW